MEILSGDYRKKFKELINAKLRKVFGAIVTREEVEYFDLLREMGESGEEKQEGTWLLKPKDYLSSGKKRLVG